MFAFLINGLVMLSFVAALYCLHGYVRERKLPFPWWKWLLCAGWLLGLLLVFAFIGTAVGEGDPGAALRGGIAFLAIAALGGVLVFALCFPGALPGTKKAAGAGAE